MATRVFLLFACSLSILLSSVRRVALLFGTVLLTSLSLPPFQASPIFSQEVPPASYPQGTFPAFWTVHSDLALLKIQEREWTLRDGTKLQGTIEIEPGDSVVVRKDSAGNGELRRLSVRLSDFIDEDQQTILQKRIKVPPQYRRYAFYAKVDKLKPVWKDVQPKHPRFFYQVVHSNSKHVFFLEGNNLILVDKEAFSKESLQKIESELEKVRCVIRGGELLGEVSTYGRPIMELPDSWVMEIPDSLLANLPPNDRTREYEPMFRILKSSLTPLGEEVLRGTLQDVLETCPPRTLSDAEASRLPLLVEHPHLPRSFRFPSDGIGEIGSVATDDFLNIRIRRRPNEIIQCPLREFPVPEHWKYLEQIFHAEGKLSQEEVERKVATRMVDALPELSRWRTKSGTSLSGQLVGRIADGFLFQVSNEGLVAFAPASQLDEYSLKVALAASPSLTTEWLQKNKPTEALARRFIPSGNNLTVACEVLPETKSYGGVLQAPSPKIRGVNGMPAERPTHYDAIAVARDAQQWLSKNEDILSNRNTEQLLASLKKRHPIPEELGDRSPSIEASRDEFAWKTKSESSFKGILVGKLGDDLVFERSIEGATKYFVASYKILDDASLKRAQNLLPRTEKKDWAKLLTIADNWQTFRVWHHEKNGFGVPSEPVVVVDIQDTYITFQYLNGSKKDTQFVSFLHKEGVASVKKFYQSAFLEAAMRKGQGETGLAQWVFMDCEPTFRGELIGESKNCYFVRDSRDREFLVSKINVHLSTKNMLARTPRPANYRSIDDDEEWKLPRIWVSRTKILGPGIPIYVTYGNSYVTIREEDGGEVQVPLSEVAQRERIAFLSAWNRYSGRFPNPPELNTVKDAASFDRWLQQPVAPKDIVRDVPKLSPEVRETLDQAIQNAQSRVWLSTPAILPPDGQLLAIDAPAKNGIVELNDQWLVVRLDTGETSEIQVPHFLSAQRGELDFGPWLGEDEREIYWIEGGELTRFDPDQRRREPVNLKQPMKLLGGTQSGNWKHFVFMNDQGEYLRWTPSNDSLELLFQVAGKGTPTSPNRQFTVSPDGRGVLNYQKGLLYRRASEGVVPSLTAISLFELPPAWRIAGKHSIWQGEEPNPRRLLRTQATPKSRLKRYFIGLPIHAAWVGVVELDGVEVIQSVGNYGYAPFVKSNKSIVYYQKTIGSAGTYVGQWIEGTIDDRSLVAANGAAILHRNGDRLVVSRRPDEVPSKPLSPIWEMVEKLLANRDFGQLEALVQTLETEPYFSVDEHPGWLSQQTQTIIKDAFIDFQPALDGDRVQRAGLLAKRFAMQYPNSQVAANVLSGLYQEIAWNARGGGYAGSVTEEGMAAFQRHMNSAKSILKPMLNKKEVTVSTLANLIDIGMATQDLDLIKEITKKIEGSKFDKSPNLHHAIAFLLLPRWYGEPGMAEAYRDTVCNRIGGAEGNILYAQMVERMLGVLGTSGPISNSYDVDLYRVMAGARAYYEERSEPDLIDAAILIMTLEKSYVDVEELLLIKFDKQILPGKFITQLPDKFAEIEENPRAEQ